MDFKINVAIDFDVLSHGMHAGNIHIYNSSKYNMVVLWQSIFTVCVCFGYL